MQNIPTLIVHIHRVHIELKCAKEKAQTTKEIDIRLKVTTTKRQPTHGFYINRLEHNDRQLGRTIKKILRIFCRSIVLSFVSVSVSRLCARTSNSNNNNNNFHNFKHKIFTWNFFGSHSHILMSPFNIFIFPWRFFHLTAARWYSYTTFASVTRSKRVVKNNRQNVIKHSYHVPGNYLIITIMIFN